MPENAAEPILLDTHIWIWLQMGDDARIAPAARRAIERAAARGSLLLSAISVWELAMLESRGRITLQCPCLQWVEMALATPGLTLVAVTPDIAIESTRLPGAIHGDPADRIIAATARCTGAILATLDENLRRYAHAGHLRLA